MLNYLITNFQESVLGGSVGCGRDLPLLWKGGLLLALTLQLFMLSFYHSFTIDGEKSYR